MTLYPVFTQEIWKVDLPSTHSDRCYAGCQILIDSGASYTAVGKDWMNGCDPKWRSQLPKAIECFDSDLEKLALVEEQ